MTGRTAFQDTWLKESAFKWLRREPNDIYSASCEICPVTFSLSTKGREALLEHMNEKKHKMKSQRLKDQSILAQYCVKKPTSIVSPPVSQIVVCASSTMTTCSANTTVPRSKVIFVFSSAAMNKQSTNSVNNKPPTISLPVSQTVCASLAAKSTITTACSANATTTTNTTTVPQSKVMLVISKPSGLEIPTKKKTATLYSAKTYQEAKDLIRQHEIATVSKFVVYKTPGRAKSFRNEISLSPKSQINWKNNVPYFHFGSELLNCHLGYDKGKCSKQKYIRRREEKSRMGNVFIQRRKLAEETKKKNCPACVVITRAYWMPQYKMVKNTSYEKHKKSTEIKKILSSGEQVPGEEIFFFNLPEASDHQFHVVGKVASLNEPLDSRVRHKIHEIVKGGEMRLDTVQALLFDFVSNELNENDRTRRAFYPLKKTISRIMTTAKREIRTSRLDIENASTMIKNWNLPENTVFFRPFLISNDDLISNTAGVLDEQTSGSEDTLLKWKNVPKDPMLFVYQNAEMKHLYQRYAGNCLFLDAPYRTLNYSVPVFFLVVKTNIDFQIVAVIISECETTEVLSEALEIIRQWNPQISPMCAVVDFAQEEITALENTYPGIEVYMCSLYRDKEWAKFFKRRVNAIVRRKEVIDNVRNIANAPTEDQLYEEIQNLRSQRCYSGLKAYFENTWLPEVKRWAAAFKSGDHYLLTNNGMKRLNEELKYDHLDTLKNCMLSELIQNLVSKFLPEQYTRYTEGNARMPSLYQSYNEVVPLYLHDRPKWLVDHVLATLTTARAEFHTERVNVRRVNLIEVISKNAKYQVEFCPLQGLVKCGCAGYEKTRLVCKHVVMAGMKYPNFNMAAISSWLFANPIFCIDDAFVPVVPLKIEEEEQILECSEICLDDFDMQELSDEDDDSGPDLVELKLREMLRKDLMSECRSNLKSIQSLLGRLSCDTLTNLSQVLTGVVHKLQSRVNQEAGR